jgi:hypothetical protein
MTKKPNADVVRCTASLSKELIDLKTGENVGEKGNKGKKAVRDFPCSAIVVESKQNTIGDTGSQIVSHRMEVYEVYAALESQEKGEDGAKEAQIDVKIQINEKEKAIESDFPLIP